MPICVFVTKVPKTPIQKRKLMDLKLKLTPSEKRKGGGESPRNDPPKKKKEEIPEGGGTK